MYVYDPLSQEQLYVPEEVDHYDEIRERNRKREHRIEHIAVSVFAIFCILLFIVSIVQLTE